MSVKQLNLMQLRRSTPTAIPGERGGRQVWFAHITAPFDHTGSISYTKAIDALESARDTYQWFEKRLQEDQN